MTFASMEFAALLLVTLLLYWSLPGRFRIPLLLAASYLFYAYWNPWYAGLILLSTVVDYTAGRFIHQSPHQRARQLAMWTSVAVNLGLLGYFKYTNFGLAVLHELLGSAASPLPRALDILLPVGISFYTFQTMAYTIDIYRRELVPERNFLTFALFVAYFPQLVAGPIERARDLLPQLRQHAVWQDARAEEGLRLLLWGFAKKLVVADRLAAIAAPLFSEPTRYGSPDLIFAALAMVTMLYFDFSAYTDMARGSSALFGIRLSENFRLPLAATNIAEFWRRWHITLSTWVRDYLYLPLGGFRPRDRAHHIRTTLLTMGLVGLWHGANWTYVIWGLQHGVIMILYQLFHMRYHRRLKNQAWAQGRAFAFAGWALTMAMHGVNMVWFFSPSLTQALAYFGRVLQPAAWTQDWYPATLPCSLVLAALWAVHASGERVDVLDRVARAAAPWRAAFYLLLLFAVVGLGVTHSASFVYFQF